MIKKFKLFDNPDWEKYKLITEDPDTIDGEIYAYCMDDDTYPFIVEFDTNDVYVGDCSSYHDDMYDVPEGMRGRLWEEKKIMSFWKYPKQENFKGIITDLENTLGIEIWNNGWKIEVLENDDNSLVTGDPKGRGQFKEKLIPIEEYVGSDDVSDETIALHLMTAAEKSKKLKEMGYKSKVSKWKKWQKPFEKKINKFDDFLFENPNQVDVMIKLPGKEEFRFRKDWSYEKPTIAFSYYDKFYSIENDSHLQLYHTNKIDSRFPRTYEYRDRLSGRLFVENQIITFWNYPKDLKELKMVVDDIKRNEDIDIWNDDWQIEIVTNPDENMDKYWNGSYAKNDFYKSILVPIKEYVGSGKRSKEELEMPHLMNYKDKQKWFKDKGYKSKVSKWKKYQKPFESTDTLIFNFDDYLLLEGRKENLKTKFKKNFGDGLGSVLFNIDFTDNKAYSDWLFSFFKNNRDKLEIGETLNKERKDMDKVQWKKDVKRLEVLENMIKKFDKNKKNFSTSIINIKTLEDFRKVLDKKDKFDSLDNYNEDEVKVYHNDIEWLVFQPFKYEISQLANRKDRDNNWCTTYNDGNFSSYLGANGGLLYCINKLDSTQDVAFQLKPNASIIAWDYKDNSTDLYSIYDLKIEFEEDSKIYKIMDDVEHEIAFPKIDMEILKQETKDWYSGLDFDSIIFDINIYLNLLDKSNYVEDFLNREIEYYNNNIVDFFESNDWDLTDTFQYIWQNGTKEFCKHFNIDIGFFLIDNPNIDDFIEELENPERLKKELDEDSKYNNDEVYQMLKQYFGDTSDDLIETLINDRYTYNGKLYTSENLIDEFYSDPYEMENKKLIDIGSNYIDYDDYIDELVNTLSDEEMMEIVYE